MHTTTLPCEIMAPSTDKRRLIPELLLRAEEIKLLVSRSEAVFLLFQAVFPASREHWFPILDSLRQASTPLINWRQKRNLTDAIMIVRGEDEQLAFEIYDAVDDQKLKKNITKDVGQSPNDTCRESFSGAPTRNQRWQWTRLVVATKTSKGNSSLAS